ncbi:E3 ubiquitin-protein ligase rha2a [Thalictrum thalictroides]|uniref:E3 ubiquitin-protein ligase rha2a n=1 Tax=Thalictrum thalictroides TaxID=46969 RepID=A0A7J6V8T2_THATH|nr:E3 ubiquitin-protein ligase rha2a [Thalictrum thalictroides]
MGLYSDLNDVQSESIPLFLVILIANCVNHLRSIIVGFVKSIGFSSHRFDSIEDVVGERLLSAVGSGLASLIVVSEQSNLNRVFGYKSVVGVDGVESSDDCIVCLCKLVDGDQVRKLACRHVFHKACLDGWLFDHLNVTCPLCRSPLVSDERLAVTERRVAGDLVSWFSMR